LRTGTTGASSWQCTGEGPTRQRFRPFVALAKVYAAMSPEMPPPTTMRRGL